jgi:hypothetical protein
MENLANKGFILAFHCVPWSVEPSIEDFWKELRLCLQKQDHELLIISTVPLQNTELLFIKIPFYLPDFCKEQLPKTFTKNNNLMIQTIIDWYQIPKSLATNVYTSGIDFFERLIDATQPAAVLSWQGANPMSRMVHEICLSRDIAWWASERGWIKDTLMLDVCDNNVLSEINKSLPAQRSMANFRPSESLLKKIRQKVSTHMSAARYPESKSNSENSSIREIFGEDTQIWAFFTHGEPHVNALSERVKRAHQMDSNLLQKCVAQLSEILHMRGAVLLVREHPFNFNNGNSLKLDGLNNVHIHKGHIDDLINSADVGLFTLSTLQFEWSLRKKPFGLLSHGLLSGNNMAPQWSNHSCAEKFINECLDAKKWDDRYREIERRIAYLYESQLIDISPVYIKNSAQEVADLLSMHSGAPVTDTIIDLNLFIEIEEMDA